MNRVLQQQQWRQIVMELALATIFAVFIFTILIMATGGVLISLITTAAALTVFGVLHYLSWGQALTSNVGRERANAAAEAQREWG